MAQEIISSAKEWVKKQEQFDQKSSSKETISLPEIQQIRIIAFK